MLSRRTALPNVRTVECEDRRCHNVNYILPYPRRLKAVSYLVNQPLQECSILTERPPPHASWVTLNKVTKLGEHQFRLRRSLLNSEAVVPSTEASVLPWTSPGSSLFVIGSENMVRSLPNLPSTRVKEQGCVKKWSQWGDIQSQH